MENPITDNFQHVRKIAKSNINSLMSASLSVWKNSAPTGRIFMKSGIWEFFENILKKKNQVLKNLTGLTSTLHEDLRTSMVIIPPPLYRPCVAQRLGRGIALLFHNRGTRREWVVSSTPRPHFTTGKDPEPIVQEAGWAPGPVSTCGKSRPLRDSIPDRPSMVIL